MAINSNVLAKKMRVRILQSVPLLAKLPENKLVKLSSVMRVQSFADGQYIIRQGEEGSRFYIINEGEVRCTRVVAGGKEEEDPGYDGSGQAGFHAKRD